ncbi:uncharacterized protein E0L32_010785 [Thyridium curvatum]|uniref:Carrier domain-containing protein n=1 Tax=Thyridium curvatum TaxID=1093900 RepID=A0A507AQX6_9PEZI|nr:uncharacterized protein E0L32_010785 [Thyridium curvatum]TPX07288.1 hypothetical protein E0L32_010785 [Thyridium curvatum]
MSSIDVHSCDNTSPFHHMRCLPESLALVHNLVHAEVEEHPNSEAVVSWDGILTYKALDDTATRLAGHLVREGVKPETIVPLLFEKSRWAVVSMLAIMKAGGAFMPLDISQPESRLRAVIAESHAAFALCSASCYELCSSLVQRAFSVTERTIADLDESTYQCPASIGDAAYVMATSGSTGKPKLVVTEHAQLSSFVAHLTQPLGFTSHTRAFQFASYAFDPIIGDIFLTLAAGGTVCIPSEEQRRRDVVEAMSSMRVNLAKFTPSFVSSVPDLTTDNLPTLKTLILGGEVAPTALIKEWQHKVDLKLIYGSTECTVSCVVQNPTSNDNIQGEIGQPVASRIWVTHPSRNNSSGEFVTVAEDDVGELVIEGPLVARGYLNAVRESNAKFSNREMHRAYRTGDLVRQLPDRRLVYAGRVDNQVKIRAQRMELEEVEENIRRALETLNVRAKSVLADAAVPLGSNDTQLLAVLCLDTTEPLGSLLCGDGRCGATMSLSPRTTRNFASLLSLLEPKMRELVPGFMVPTLWVPIDDMPFTLSRKRDRQRIRHILESFPARWLAAFSNSQGNLLERSNAEGFILTENEDLLRKLWSSVLGIDSTSIQPDDNFFHLGGDSLLVMKMISMARRVNIVLVAEDVFAHPVLKHLAPELVSLQQSADLAPFSLLEPSVRLGIRQETALQCGVRLEDIEDIFPLYSMQEQYVFSYPELGRGSSGPWDWQQQIVFLLPESFNIPLFKSIWSDAVRSHPQLRTRVVKTSHGVYQAALRNEVAPTWREVDNLDDYVRWDRQTSMSFGDELLRLAITKSTQPCHFVLTMQHLIYDAYSRDMLFKELESAYKNQSYPRTHPPKVSQFIKYVNGADRQLGSQFWSAYLAGSSTKALLSAAIGSEVKELQIHRWTLAKPHLPPLDYTLATIIECSVALAISRLLNCRDVVFYSDRAGRNLPVAGIQDLMAPATLYLPLRVRVDPRQRVHDLLYNHQRANTAMMPYEYMGFTELRKLDNLKDVLGHALNMNINPYTPLGEIGASMGLTVVDEHERWGDPFTVDVSVRENELRFAVYFDEKFVRESVVKEMMRHIKEAFRLLSTAHMNLRVSVGDILQNLSISNNS